jgi:hypothetical protein
MKSASVISAMDLQLKVDAPSWLQQSSYDKKRHSPNTKRAAFDKDEVLAEATRLPTSTWP